jgi:hypothetical protein
MLKFEIRNSIVDEEIVSEDDLELVSNVGVDTVKMREIEMQEFSKTVMYASVDNHLPYCWLLLSWKRYVYLYIS